MKLYNSFSPKKTLFLSFIYNVSWIIPIYEDLIIQSQHATDITFYHHSCKTTFHVVKTMGKFMVLTLILDVYCK